MNQATVSLHRRIFARQTCLIGVGIFALLLAGCGSTGEQSLMVSSNASATGSAVTLAWDNVNDPSIIGYYVHYGKQSPNQQGSCSYDQWQFVMAPDTTVTITNLDPGVTYYFAVSAYNGIESDCSNEVSTST